MYEDMCRINTNQGMRLIALTPRGCAVYCTDTQEGKRFITLTLMRVSSSSVCDLLQEFVTIKK